MHPAGSPKSIKVADCEPIPGRRAMCVFLDEKVGREAFHYRLVLAGDAAEGYAVASISRGGGPNPVDQSSLPGPVTDEESESR
jgi:hypothetical protein